MTYNHIAPAAPHVCQGRFRYLLYRSAAAALIGLPACASAPKDDLADDLRQEGQALFGGPRSASTTTDTQNQSPTSTRRSAPPPRSRAASNTSTTDGWAIVLEYLRGPDHQRSAALRRLALARELQRDDLSIRSRHDGSIVVLGSYTSINDPNAQADLDWIRAFPRGNTTPFLRAHLVPPVPAEADQNPEISRWNLAGIRDTRAGAGKALTLQVAVFDGNGSLDRARAAAEAHTIELRRAGEDAYFFHGPALSVVTIGLFAATEADAAGNPASRAARDARRAHPLNLKNGTDPIPDRTGTPQPSPLVRLP